MLFHQHLSFQQTLREIFEDHILENYLQIDPIVETLIKQMVETVIETNSIETLIKHMVETLIETVVQSSVVEIASKSGEVVFQINVRISQKTLILGVV